MGNEKNRISISKSVNFAMEMVRSSLNLASTRIRRGEHWLQTDISIGRKNSFKQRIITLSIIVYPKFHINAKCIINDSNDNDAFMSGKTEITVKYDKKKALSNEYFCFRVDPIGEGRFSIVQTR